MDSADVLYAATRLLFPTCNITITAESYRPGLGMYEVSKLQAWEVHSLKISITHCPQQYYSLTLVWARGEEAISEMTDSSLL